MKLKKKFILLVFVFLCCGCTIDYKININSDMSVKEEIIIPLVATEQNENFQNYLTSFKERYGAFYNYSIVEENLIISRTYYSFEDFRDSLAINEYFGKIDLNNNKELRIISEKIKCNDWFYDDYAEQEIATANIFITVPFPVTGSNALEQHDNTYIWHYDINDCNNSELRLAFSNKTISNVSNTGWNVIEIVVGTVLVGATILFAFITYRKKGSNNV